MYRLYVSRNSAGMGAHAMLRDMGVAHETAAVDTSKPRPPAYLALNPLGRVPTLVETDSAGRTLAVVYQSAAIMLHLADRHPESGMAPPPGTHARALCHQWLWFVAESLQPAYLMHFHPENCAAAKSAHAGVDARASELLDQAWGVLDGALDPGPYVFGARPGVCDFNLLTFALWHKPSHRPLARHARVARAMAGLAARPSVAAVMAENGKTLSL